MFVGFHKNTKQVSWKCSYNFSIKKAPRHGGILYHFVSFYVNIMYFHVFSFQLLGLWPEEHKEKSIWCLKCIDGNEYNFKRKERDQMDRIAYKLSSRVPKLGGKILF